LTYYEQWLTYFIHLENDQLRGLCRAEIPKDTVSLHRRLMEDIASAVDFGRVRIDLALDLSSQNVGEHGPRVLMCCWHGGSGGRN
jgi:hypothetical protein